MRIVLLTYVNRSGSTYLANLLSASDDICVCPEGDVLVSLFLESPGKAFRLDMSRREKLVKLIQSDSKLRHWGIRDDIFTALEEVNSNIGAFLAFLLFYRRHQKPEASCILFKAERLVDLIYTLEKNRPTGIDFKYLCLIRDPRGIYASQKRTMVPATGRIMNTHPVYTAMFWNHYIKTILRYREHVGLHQILYQDLIQQMENTMGYISVYMGMDLMGVIPVEGDLADRLPDGDKKIHQTIKDLPQPAKIDEWMHELSREEIMLIERICKKHFREFRLIASHLNNNKTTITCNMVFHILRYKGVHLLQKVGFHFNRIFSLAN